MARRKSYYKLYKYTLISLLIITMLLIVYKFHLSTDLVPMPYNIFTNLILFFGAVIATHIISTLAILFIQIASYYLPKSKVINKLRKQSYLIIPKNKIKEYTKFLVAIAIIFIVFLYIT